MNPEDLKQRALKFIGTSSGIRFGSFGTPITRRISLVPRRSAPQQVISKLQPSGIDDGITTTQRDISSLGKVTLNLEQTKNNLERIVQVISEDYKNTQEQNKKETEEYRKRIANRGRIFGRKELGDKKSDVLGAVKKYVGSFFSGAGGAIRALSMFNLMQGILSGDPSKIIGPLLGIGLTYLPAIGAGIAGAITTSLVGKLFGGGAATRAAASAAPAAAGAGSALGRFGRFAGRAGLVAGGIGLASSIFNRPQEDQTQNRLEELTQQQKASVEPGNIVSLPQDDLRRFETLNNKFEKALDFLLAKQKETPAQRTSGGGGGGGGGSPGPTSTPLTSLSGDLKEAAQTIMGYESANSGGYNAMNRGTGGDSPEGAEHYLGKKLTDMSIGDVIDLQSKGKLHAAGAYQFTPNTLPEAMTDAGLKSSDKFDERNQDLMFANHFRKYGPRKWTGNPDSKQSQQVISRLNQLWENVKNAPPPSILPSPNTYPSMSSTILDESVVDTSSVIRRNIPAPQAATPTIVPMVVPQQSASQPTSATSESNDSVPSIDTTYPENFLALYSKLIYQIV